MVCFGSDRYQGFGRINNTDQHSIDYRLHVYSRTHRELGHTLGTLWPKTYTISLMPTTVNMVKLKHTSLKNLLFVELNSENLEHK